MLGNKKGFGLIELLISVSLVAALSTFVLVSVNPGELIRQSKDASRMSDMAQINFAVNIFQVDNPSGSIGDPSTVYVSVPDPAATSTLGDQCDSLGLPALPSGWIYHCAAPSAYRNTNGTGWIPVNFSSISYGSTFATLPVDPINNASSGNYYTYTAKTGWEVASLPESQKYRTSNESNPTGALIAGSDKTISPIFNSVGLAGYWNFNDASGTVAHDSSSNNNPVNLNNSPSWEQGQVGGALDFNGTDEYAVSDNDLDISGDAPLTMCAWVKWKGAQWTSGDPASMGNNSYANSKIVAFTVNSGKPGIEFGNGNWRAKNAVSVKGWHHFCAVKTPGSISAHSKLYVDGSSVDGVLENDDSPPNIEKSKAVIGRRDNISYFQGLIDDARFYGRALSDAEIKALYNATK